MFQRKDLPTRTHIALVSRSFPIHRRTAGRSFLYPLARALALRGFKVTVLSWQDPDGRQEFKASNLDVYFLGHDVRRGRDLFRERLLQKFAEVHLKDPVHLMHSFEAASLDISEDRKKLKIATAYDVEATQMSQIYSLLGMSRESIASSLNSGITIAYKFLSTYLRHDRRLLRSADGVFCTSPHQQTMLERFYLYPYAKTFRIPYGIEVEEGSEAAIHDPVRTEHEIPKSTQLVLTLSDMNEVEELAHLFRVFQKVVIKKPSVRLMVIGLGPRFKEIEYHALTLALGAKVIFCGAVETAMIPEYIRECDIYVNLTAKTTGFEPSLLEAMAQKKVVIGSEVSPVSSLIESGEDGFLVRPADVAELSELILRLLHQPLTREEIGEKARAKVSGLFDFGQIVDRVSHSYQKLLLSTKWYRKASLSRPSTASRDASA